MIEMQELITEKMLQSRGLTQGSLLHSGSDLLEWLSERGRRQVGRASCPCCGARLEYHEQLLDYQHCFRCPPAK